MQSDSTVQQRKDKALMERDTRRWCLDRCLATGYCDAIEDLWEMDTMQVKKFCQECASLDECELSEDKVDQYMGHLSAALQAVKDADGGSGCHG